MQKKKKVSVNEIAKKMQKGELDEICSVLLRLLQPHLEDIQEEFDRERFGLKKGAFLALVMPIVFSKEIPTSSFFLKQAQTELHLAHIFHQIEDTGGCASFRDLYHYLHEAQARFANRREQASKAEWSLDTPVEISKFRTVFCSSQPINDYVLCIESGANDTSQLSVMNEKLIRLPDIEERIRAAVTGVPSAVEVIPTLDLAVVSTASNKGSHVHLLRGCGPSVGACLKTIEVSSHATTITWDGIRGRLLVGSSLGEISTFAVHSSGAATLESMGKIHNGPVVGLSPCSLQAVVNSVGADGYLCIVDPTIGTVVRSIQGSKSAFTTASFDKVNNLIAACNCTPVPLVWQSSLPPRCVPIKLEDQRRPHHHMVCSVLCDGSRSQIASLDVKGVVKIWDARMFNCLQTLECPAKVAERKVNEWTQLFSLSSSAVGSSCDGGMYRYFVSTAESDDVHGQCATDPVTSVSVSLKGAGVLTTSQKSAKLWSVATGEVDIAIDDFAQSTISTACLSESQTYAYIGDVKGQLYVVNMATGKVEHTCKRHNGKITAVCASGDTIVVSCGSDGTIQFSSSPHFHLYSLMTNIYIVQIQLIYRYGFFAFLTSTGVIELFEATLAPFCETLSPASRMILESVFPSSTPTAFTFLSNMSSLVISAGTEICVLMYRSGVATVISKWKTRGGTELREMVYSPHDQLLICYEKKGMVSVYTLHDILINLENESPTDTIPILSFVFSPTGSRAVSALCMAPCLSAIFLATVALECVIFRFDGVLLGALDVDHNVGEWHLAKPAARMLSIKRGATGPGLSSKGLMMDTGTSKFKEVPECKHKLKLHKSSSPVILSPDNEHSPRPVAQTPPPRLAAPPSETAASTKKRRKSQLHSPVMCFPTLPPLGPECSKRTEPLLDLADSKWTLDYVPPKERSTDLVQCVRYITASLNPSPQVVDECHKVSKGLHDLAVQQQNHEKYEGGPLPPVRARSVSPVKLGKPPDAMHRSVSRSQVEEVLEEVPVWMKQKKGRPKGGGGFLSDMLKQTM